MLKIEKDYQKELLERQQEKLDDQISELEEQNDKIEDDIIERDEISAFVKDKFRNSYSNNNDSVERTNLNRRKVLSASSSLSKYNFAYNTFK